MAIYHINRAQSIAERLLKLRDYLYINASPTHAVRASDILTYLANEGHEVEIKTVYSDLKTLEIHFGLDLHYDGRQRGYLLNNPPFAPYELREIVNSVQAAKFITQEEADKLTAKLMRLADRHTRHSLNRKTFVQNRVRDMNEDAMRGLDAIYDAIAQDRKISFKFFHYTINKDFPKKYINIGGSKVITGSPYIVTWDGERFIVMIIIERRRKLLQHYFPLEYLEQIKILPDEREGHDIAERRFEYEAQSDKVTYRTKLNASNRNITGLIEKFGTDIHVTPIDDEFFIAAIKESITPELYLWLKEFMPPIEVIYPEDTESEMRAFFSKIGEGDYYMMTSEYLNQKNNN